MLSKKRRGWTARERVCFKFIGSVMKNRLRVYGGLVALKELLVAVVR